MARICRLVASPFCLWRHLVTTGTQVVHVNTSLNSKSFWRDVVYVVVAVSLGRRVLYQIHGGAVARFALRRPIRTLGLRLVTSLADALVVLSEKERAALRCVVGEKEVSVVRNAVNCADYGKEPRKSFEKQTLQLAYVGRLDREKGLHEALEAISILEREHGLHCFSMRIAGSGPEATNLREAVSRLGLNERVRFVGALFGEEKIRLLVESDIFVFPSYHEGLPYSVLESLASGTPAVVSGVGAIPEFISNGIHGLIVEPRSSRMIAAALKRLMENRQLLRTMSDACIELAHREFDIQRLEYQLGEIYFKLSDS